MTEIPKQSFDLNVVMENQILKRYNSWYRGHLARLEGKPCAEVYGDYLDGYYSPKASIPEFLTQKEAARLRSHPDFRST